MSFTRNELVAEIRALADAENDTRWNSTTVLRFLDVVHDREWGRILATYPYTRLSHLTVTPDADGYVDKADLSSGSGDAQQRFYRIVGLHDGSRRWGPADTSDNLLTPAFGQNFEARGSIYWWEGDRLRLSPTASGATVTATVTHRPTLPSGYTDGAVTVVFPEPWELLLAYGTAAMMLSKGGTETQASADLLALAEGMRDDMLADLSRRDIQPVTFRFSDSRADWGG